MLRITSILLLALPVLGIAQSQEDALASVNAAFEGAVVFKMDKQARLIMDCYDKGTRYRQDIAPIAQLDAEGVYYSPEEEAVVLSCATGHSNCLSKEIFKLDMLRMSSRANIPCPTTDDSGTRCINALKALLGQANNGLAAGTDETLKHSPRKKGR